MKLSTQDLITIKEALEELYTNGIDGIRSVDLDESDRLIGVFREGAKLYDFMLNPRGETPKEQISYKPKNPEVVNKKDSEIDWQQLLKNDACTFFIPSALRLDKKKNCVQQPCGNTCISMGKECNPDEPLSEKSRGGLMGLIDKIKGFFTGKKNPKSFEKLAETPKAEPKTQSTAPVKKLSSSVSGVSSKEEFNRLYSDWDDDIKAIKNEDVDLKVSGDRLDAANELYDSIKKESSTWDGGVGGVKGDDGKLKAAYLYNTKDDSIYLEYLVTSPDNIIAGRNPAKGAGTQAIKDLVQRSIDEGFDGKISLSALPDAIPFYEKLGFEFDPNDKYRFGDMTLSPEKAKQLLRGQK